MAKYYTGVVVKQTGEKDNTYYFHDAILVDKKGGAVAFSTTEGTYPTLEQQLLVWLVYFARLQNTMDKMVKIRNPGISFKQRRK